MTISKYSLAGIMLAAACICGQPAMAQEDDGENRGTPEQQAACTPDAFRLCSYDIPDAGRVEACLRQHKADLSNACRSVFDGRATTASIRGHDRR